MDSLPPFGGLHHPALVSLLHLPAKLRGGDACQKGLSSPPLSKQETHTREHAEEPPLVSLEGGDAGQEETHTRREGKEKD